MKMKDRTRTKNIENFISGADTKHATDDIKENAPIFKRVTFSLDVNVKEMIEKLSMRSTKFKTSNSDIVRAAIHMLNASETKEFEESISIIKTVKKLS
tara:strand:+ start:67 stop:360 length:294 start_codon:yes stop_codon:yes gene_type:complete